MDSSQANTKLTSTRLTLITWAVVLLVSDLPNAIWQVLDGGPPAWLFWAKTGLLLILILGSLIWKMIRPLRNYFILLLALMLVIRGMGWFMGTTAYHRWEDRVGWIAAMAGFQLLKLAGVFIMIIVLLMMGKRREEFFLRLGELKAPVSRGKSQETHSKRSLSWGCLGLILGLCIAPLTLLFFGLGSLPSADILAKALVYFPVALLFAATNAFSEEMQFRASLLGELQKNLGDDHAIWISAVFFGFAHYFGGAPEGIPGVLIAGLLGALFAKCMLGSKGIMVPWFIHFCQNAIIYSFWAIDAVA